MVLRLGCDGLLWCWSGPLTRGVFAQGRRKLHRLSRCSCHCGGYVKQHAIELSSVSVPWLVLLHSNRDEHSLDRCDVISITDGGSSLCAHRLNDAKIGNGGAKALGSALVSNTALNSLE